jgi:crossover junction endodeoxyribonuclease RusA
VTVTIRLPWSRPPLSQNDRDERKRGGARKIAAVKEEARLAIRAAKVTPVVGAVVTLHWLIPTRHRRDSDNLGPTLKVCQDALVLEGILPDDSWVHVPRSACEIHPPNGETSTIWLELTNIHPYDTEEA